MRVFQALGQDCRGLEEWAFLSAQLAEQRVSRV